MPTDQVRGLKAHGTSPAKTKLAGELLPLAAARFFPGQPCALRERVPSAARRVRDSLIREVRDLPGLPGQFQNMQPGVGAVDDVDIAAIVDLDIVCLDRHFAALLAIVEI